MSSTPYPVAIAPPPRLPAPTLPEKLPSVAIVVPSGNTVHADFCLSLAMMCYNLNELPLMAITTRSSIVAEGRNSGVQMAQDSGAEYVFFIDSDMTFPTNTLLRLLMRGVDVVGATYSRRTPPLIGLGEFKREQPTDAPVGLMEMDRIPTGCLLIRTSVFERLRRPYFRFRTDEDAGMIVGEDYDFSDRVRALGYRIWCDPALSKELGHLGQQTFML